VLTRNEMRSWKNLEEGDLLTGVNGGGAGTSLHDFVVPARGLPEDCDGNL